LEYLLNEKYPDLFSTISNSENDIRRKSVRGGAAMMGVEIASSLLRVGSMTILARLLLPQDFGLFAMVIALTIFAERFKDLGLSDATVQAREITHVQVSGLFWINLAACIGIALFLASISKAMAWFYNEPRLTAITLVIASTFIFSGLTIQHQAVLRRQLRFSALALIQLYSIILSLLVAIALAYYGFGYWALVAREFSRTALIVIGTWIACPWRPSLPRRKTGVARLLHFGKNLTGFSLVHFFARSVDDIIIGKLQGPYWVGLYTNAFNLMALPVNQIQYPVRAVALPTLSALQTEPDRFRKSFENIVRLLTFISMPAVAFIALFGDILVKLLLGPKWMMVVPIFRIFAVAAFVEPITNSIDVALMAYGRTKERFKLGAMNSFFFLCCVAVGSLWGTIGVTIGYSIAMYIALFISFVYGLKYTPVQIGSLLRILAPNCLISLFTFFVLFCVRRGAGWSLGAGWLVPFLLAGIVIYLGLWSIIPGGRDMLRGYMDKAANLMPRLKRS